MTEVRSPVRSQVRNNIRDMCNRCVGSTELPEGLCYLVDDVEDFLSDDEDNLLIVSCS